MRRGFAQQLTINITPIGEVVIPKEKRDHLANLMSALQHLYRNEKYSRRVEAIIRKTVNKGRKHTGRTGLNLWEIFVLAQTRLCMNLSYDQLLSQANYHQLLRGILGVAPNDYTLGRQYTRQNIYDNVSLLDDQTLQQINELIVEMGHDVFKKKETTALRLKTDSFVVETDTYFPTDYRLLYDSGRKCLELIAKLDRGHDFKGWRQWKSLRKKLKGLYRGFGKVTSGGGRNKQERELASCKNYLDVGKSLSKKVTGFLCGQAPLLFLNKASITTIVEIEWFKSMLDKHIDLLERRIVRSETIPQNEKLFSVFQPFTEWINKGKKNPSVEIGKKLFITTDQYHLIVDHQLGDKLNDHDAITGILDRIHQKYSLIASMSTDKGFSTKANKALISAVMPDLTLVMPKKGKRNLEEEQEEKTKKFTKLNNAHNAIESNINELEHRGLDRCPDRSAVNFSKYVSLAVTAYNLHRIGRELITIEVAKEKKQRKTQLRKAA